MGCIHDILKDVKKEGEDISKNVEFLCPNCGKLSPEILNINIEKKNVQFNCPICTEKRYFSNSFYNQIDPNDSTTKYYCVDQNQNRFLFKEYINNPMNSSDSPLTNTKPKLKLNKESIKIIKEKNEQLKKIIRFNKIMINTCEKYKNNYFYLISLKNISVALKKEEDRDTNDLNYLLTCFKNEIKKSDTAIDNLNNETKLEIEREEKSLYLIDKKLNNENIKCLSQIKFNQLIEIDLSENGIIDIEPLCNMNLPFLEFLNLSSNKIKNINPLGRINSKKLKYLLIHNNEIEDINILKSPEFMTFDILALENNKGLVEDSKPFKELISLYENSSKLLVTSKKFEEIKNQYNLGYDENTKKVEVKEVGGGDLMLKEIFIIIIHKNKNKIQELKLTGNKIEDPSILKRIQFNYLNELNLSVNSIKNLNFLKQMKAKSLKTLYLNNNEINDISLLDNIRTCFEKLDSIILYGNKIDPNDSKNNNIKSNLYRNGINLKLIDDNNL